MGKLCGKTRLMIVGALMYVSHLSGNHWQAGSTERLRISGYVEVRDHVPIGKRVPGCGGWNTTQVFCKGTIS